MRIKFKVEGHSPKKQENRSMWSQRKEAILVVSLREKALEEMRERNCKGYFRSLVSLKLTVFIPRPKLESIGDLDTFVAGVCDGLQAAHPNRKAGPGKEYSYLHEIFQEPRNAEIDPKRPLLIENDAKVITIAANKFHLDEGQEVKTEYYIVEIEEVSETENL